MDKNFNFKDLNHGFKLALENAKQMLEESKILESHGYIARAYTLCQLSIEETGKCIILLTAIFDNFRGLQVDEAYLNTRGFFQHKSKTRISFGCEEVFLSYIEKLKKIDISPYREVIKEEIDNVSEYNNRKNSSLYVGIQDGYFVSPNECITSDMLNDIRASAELKVKVVAPFLLSEEKMKECARLLPEVLKEQEDMEKN